MFSLHNLTNRLLQASICLFILSACSQPARLRTEVLVIGGGTSGTAAGIQSARSGARTIIAEPTPWLGGMISAAGVTCADGNHQMPAGLWGDFRDRLYQVYGGADAVATGWVSNTQFEPHVSDSIWKRMAAAETNLTIRYGWQYSGVKVRKGQPVGAYFTQSGSSKKILVTARVLIDATEMGDALAASGIPYDLGMEAGHVADEQVGITASNDIVQDLTYVAVLKDYGAAADCTIAKPAGYRPEEFDGACTDYYINKSLKAPTVDGKKMLDYGRLPNGKYMINWPNAGNDAYLNLVEKTEAERAQALEAARQTTLRFVYFIQHQLKMKNLGLADDEFPTADRLALMPYYREGRRVQGITRLNIRQIAEPFTYKDPLYRTGIAVGDYPIDHHHKKNPEAPQHLEFYAIPSYNIPLGSLIPKKGGSMIVAEKAISVSNVVNGTTRLQPVVIQIGQVAGLLAAQSVRSKLTPEKVPVRQLQQALLEAGGYLMPYIDVKRGHPQFAAVQRIGATGMLRGLGVPYKWANQTWFYPDAPVHADSLYQHTNAFLPAPAIKHNGPYLTAAEAASWLETTGKSWGASSGINAATLLEAWQKDAGKDALADNTFITRAAFAVMADAAIRLFNIPIDHRGYAVAPSL